MKKRLGCYMGIMKALRESPFNDPIPIYPDFIKEPHYTAEGIPIATAMQNVCEFYNGKNDDFHKTVDFSCRT